MTTVAAANDAPRTPALARATAARLAATEYQRFIDLLTSLGAAGWTEQTDCPQWDVRAMATHALGMAEMAASIREQMRQVKTATTRGGVFIDALTALQVEERAGMQPADIIERFVRVAPKAARGRRMTPWFIKRRTMPQHQVVGGREEMWTIGYLLDVILTRDPWMHRIDITRATGAAHTLTPEHDGVIVDDLVSEWAKRHGKPFRLDLHGPAGGSWTVGDGGPRLELGVVEFCRAISGRAPVEGLLATAVPF
ncbi:MAG: maleylpyruvate isomerase family mycothiol-dependent enzyme [Jatrophihabitantaceae bacterium]